MKGKEEGTRLYKEITSRKPYMAADAWPGELGSSRLDEFLDEPGFSRVPLRPDSHPPASSEHVRDSDTVVTCPIVAFQPRHISRLFRAARGSSARPDPMARSECRCVPADLCRCLPNLPNLLTLPTASAQPDPANLGNLPMAVGNLARIRQVIANEHLFLADSLSSTA